MKTMKREYVRGNKEHWKEVYEWACGKKPDEDYDCERSCYASDTCIILKQGGNAPFLIYEDKGGYYIYKALYDVITTNPNWHEVKPWEDKPYEPRPFDKVLGWNDFDPSNIRPDIFLCENDLDDKTIYVCANYCFEHVKPYDEKEYTERTEEL